MTKIKYVVLLTSLLVFLSSCRPEQEATAVSVEKIAADLILNNGKIVSVDDTFSIHDTIVVSDGRVVELGDASLLDKYSATTVRDLQGKTLIPGFIDSHTHIRGRPRRYIELSEVGSIAEMQDLIRAKAAELGEGEWITGYGWSEDELAEGRKPLRGDLDIAAPNNPITFTRAGGHSAVVSTLALELANITDETPDPEGGVIERDENGVANGVIRERQEIVGTLVPDSTYEELIASLEINLGDLLAKGITSITDASKRPDEYAMWEELYAKPGVNLPRSAIQFQWFEPEAIAELKARVGDGNEYLKIGPIKIFADGGFTGPAAFTKEPYLNQGDYRGYLNMPEEELVSLINEVHDAGWQMGIHAIGDAAIELVVDTLADALTRNPREDHRSYLNHFSMRPSDATMEKMAQHGIHITQQPNFTYTLEGRYVANLDGWRLEHNNPVRSPMDHGIHVAISSDILPIGPLVGIYAAVTRKGMSGRVFGADEAITIEEAIQGYTIKGAYLGFEEDIKGSLEPGKLADMIVLSKDILTVDPEEIMGIEIEQTYVGGNLVFQN
ncbi:MAG: amidohydrolase [Gammaproteobacteria bacterium]|nr:amidohydrolase [Gammaproteobacteria bacterium]MBT6482772.1 amidohydrolase [Gammaproteobacteria bacterium]MBT7225767.1 amidohydrolase [Gammaproteobacteria bacterium]